MWVLEGDSEFCKDFSIWLVPGRKYTCGRKDADITLTNDKSVSRTHATIEVSDCSVQEIGNLGARTVVTVTDANSKFGTVLNRGNKVTGSAEIKEGDTVQFGVNQARLRLTYIPVVLCCSGIKSKQRSELFELARRYDLKIAKDWSRDCTHLVMSTLRVTMKVILALAHRRYIITDGWIRAFAEVDPLHFKMPNAEPFLPPPIQDTLVLGDVNYAPNEKRATALSGHQFVVFSDEEYKSLEKVILGAGGEIEKFSADNTAEQLAQYLKSLRTPCVIQPSSTIPQEPIINQAIARLGLRLIHQDDIAKAILHVNADPCNPYNNSEVVEAPAQSSITDANQAVWDSSLRQPKEESQASAGTGRKGFEDFLDDLIGATAGSTSKPPPPSSVSIAPPPNRALTRQSTVSLAERLGLEPPREKAQMPAMDSSQRDVEAEDLGLTPQPQRVEQVGDQNAAQAERESTPPATGQRRKRQRSDNADDVPASTRTDEVQSIPATPSGAGGEVVVPESPTEAIQSTAKRRKRTALAKVGISDTTEGALEAAIRQQHSAVKKEGSREASPTGEGGDGGKDLGDLKGLVTVEVVPLIVRVAPASAVSSVQYGGPNFKRFRKTQLQPQRVIKNLEPYERDREVVLGKDGQGWLQPASVTKRMTSQNSTPKGRATTRRKRNSRGDEEEEEEEEWNETESEEEEPIDLGDDDDDDDVEEVRVMGRSNSSGRISLDDGSQVGWAEFAASRAKGR